MGNGANGFELWACASVVFAVGVPAFVWQSGAFVAAITDTGVGDVSVVLDATEGVDATESFILVTARAAQAASGGIALGVVHTSDTAKQITIVQEAAMGAASIRADIDFDIAIFKRINIV